MNSYSNAVAKAALAVAAFLRADLVVLGSNARAFVSKTLQDPRARLPPHGRACGRPAPAAGGSPRRRTRGQGAREGSAVLPPAG